MKKVKLFLLAVTLLLVGIVIAGNSWMKSKTAPMPDGETQLVRFESGLPFGQAMKRMKEMGVIQDVTAITVYAKLKGKFEAFRSGTFEVKPGMTADEVFVALNKPVKQLVRIPEGWWIARIAKRLEEKNVCKAEEYIEWASKPQEFAKYVDFKLPEKSLEGYLYPDTYDLPPMLGARETIKIQLRNFKKRVIDELPKDANIDRLVNIGSMVELETALDEERPRVAGVIENRIRKGMRLQIDATVLYALQEWKNLGPGIVNTVDSPFNTYRIDGLPPGPIGSPSAASILASHRPESHNYYFYVAMPDKSHLFSTEYSTHLSNINRARAAARAVAKAQG
jgi:UPF0755 protein